MVDPQLHRPAAFFRCLEAMQPVEMEFTTQLGQSLSPLTYNEILSEQMEVILHCNLLIRGKIFILYGLFAGMKFLSYRSKSFRLYLQSKGIVRYNLVE